MYDFQQAENVSRQRDAKDGEIELLELEPSVAGMLVLDLDDAALLSSLLDEKGVWLAPAKSLRVSKLEPGTVEIPELASSKREEREELLHLSLISNSDCESSTALSSSYKLRLSGKETGTCDFLGGKETLSRLGLGEHAPPVPRAFSPRVRSPASLAPQRVRPFADRTRCSAD